jgi:hypothetical protein
VDRNGKRRLQQVERLRRSPRVEVTGPEDASPASDGKQGNIDLAGKL